MKLAKRRPAPRAYQLRHMARYGTKGHPSSCILCRLISARGVQR